MTQTGMTQAGTGGAEATAERVAETAPLDRIPPREGAVPARLVLSDGTAFAGWGFGARGETAGEVVFNTSMAGYQELLTDPSYRAQLVVMTYPLIGNYGVNEADVESARPQAAGLVVRQYQEHPSSYRATQTLHRYLEDAGIVGIDGIDTRALTRHLRSRGVMEGVVSTLDLERGSLTAKARSLPGMAGRDLVREVTCAAPYQWLGGGSPREFTGFAHGAASVNVPPPLEDGARFHVVAYDFGIKWNLLRCLHDLGARVTVVPSHTSAKDVLAMAPDGIFLSNGPGDPAALPEIVHEVRELLGKKPVFGVCLGHQLMGLALGGRTFKLKFGHRGGNQPVMDLGSRRVSITSQNHGFAVDGESLGKGAFGAGARVTHVNLNDQTVEGLGHDGLDCFSVQHHPEAAPGPRDAGDLFSLFAERLQKAAHGRR